MVNYFKNIWDEFIYGGHLLSLGAVSIVYFEAILLNIKITWDFLLISYLGSQSVYLYNRYKELGEDFLTNPERTKHIQKYYKKIPIIILLCLLFFFVIFFYFNKIISLSISLFVFFLSFSYTLFFKKITKKIPSFKNFFVSLTWSLLILILVTYYFYSLNLAVLLVSVFVFLRWFINTSFFDVKDIENDKNLHLLTLPAIWGKNRFLNFLHIINFLSFMPIIIGISRGIFPYYSLSLLILFFYCFCYIEKTKSPNANIKIISYLIVDGEFILWPMLLILSKYL